MVMREIVRILRIFRKGMTSQGKYNVSVKHREIKTEYIKSRELPEAYTQTSLIEPTLKLLGIESILPQREISFPGIGRSDTERRVDYAFTSKGGMEILMESKPFNADLRKNTKDGCLNQIKGIFRLAEVQKKYRFGIATDGKKYIIVDNEGDVIGEYDIVDDFNKIEKIINGAIDSENEKVKEEINKRFYDWYQALLIGGEYTDNERKKSKIEEKDALANSIDGGASYDQKRQLAQITIDRLIFIKFLQTKGIISHDILKYISGLSVDIINEKLQHLFFYVLNTKSRMNVDKQF